MTDLPIDMEKATGDGEPYSTPAMQSAEELAESEGAPSLRERNRDFLGRLTAFALGLYAVAYIITNRSGQPTYLFASYDHHVEDLQETHYDLSTDPKARDLAQSISTNLTAESIAGQLKMAKMIQNGEIDIERLEDRRYVQGFIEDRLTNATERASARVEVHHFLGKWHQYTIR